MPPSLSLPITRAPMRGTRVSTVLALGVMAALALAAVATGAHLLRTDGRADRTEPTPSAQAPHRGDTPDPRAQMEANIALLDARYAAEPIDPAWATRHEAHVRDFFDRQRLAAQGLAGPASLETSCHSQTCRVSVRYADPLTAELATQHLAMHVSPRLPFAAVLPRALGDGSIQVEAWYSRNRATL
jgi:hypothetical protein